MSVVYVRVVVLDGFVCVRVAMVLAQQERDAESHEPAREKVQLPEGLSEERYGC